MLRFASVLVLNMLLNVHLAGKGGRQRQQLMGYEQYFFHNISQRACRQYEERRKVRGHSALSVIGPPSGANNFTVQHFANSARDSYVVDVLTRMCTCGVPQHSGWPCTHVFAALQLAARPADAVLYDVKKCLFCQNCAAHVYLLQLPRTWIAPRGCASRI